LYQLALVMGSSVMWGFLGSYFLLRLGSDGFAMGEGCCGTSCVEAMLIDGQVK
jgi:hypothetical protein